MKLAVLRNLAGQELGEQSGFSLETLVGWIDWSEAEALRRGDIAALPVALRGPVKMLARLSAVTKLAKVLGISAVAVVIALLAGSSANRNAARVFRSVLGKADATKVKAAAKAMSLIPPPSHAGRPGAAEEQAAKGSSIRKSSRTILSDWFASRADHRRGKDLCGSRLAN